MSSMLKLLILEDRSEDVELVLYELRRAGFHPRWWHAENEEQYAQYLAANEVDIILADYMLPQFDALKALQMVKDRNLDVPFIVVTGTVSEEIVVQCMNQGAADYLLKDRLTRLGQAITRALEERNLRVDKRRTEAALYESDERFRRLAENAQDIIYRMRLYPDFAVEYISPAVAQIIGYTPQEFYHDSTLWKKILHEDDFPYFNQRIFQEKNTANHPIRILRRDGQVRWLETRDTAILDSRGQLVAVEGVTRDVTERVLAEDALRESEEKFKAIFQESLDVIFIADTDSGLIIKINDAARRVLGYDPDTLVGKHFSVLFGPERVRVEMLGQTDALGAMFESNIFLRADGSQCPMDVTATMIPWGKTHAILATLRDVTEREQSAEALRHNDAKMRALLDGIPDSMFLVSGEGIILECKFPGNNGHIAEQLIGRDISELTVVWRIPVETLNEAREVLRRALETRQPQALEVHFENSGNDDRYFDLRAAASGSNEVVMIVRDVTESRQAHEALLRAEIMNAEIERERELVQLKESFISMVSHEFRTPLAVIMASIETLENFSDRLSPERRMEKLRKVRAQTEYMAELLSQVLFISGSKAGKLRFRPKEINLITFCKDMIEHTKLRGGYKQHKITFHHKGDLGSVWLDDKLLQHILMNLLENAVKYSPPSSEIIFEVRAEGDYIVFKVSDKGIGIPLDDQQHLFEAFHRATNAESIGGTGLGLSIVKSSVDVHQGIITYDSQPDVGTTFTVLLPLAVGEGV